MNSISLKARRKFLKGITQNVAIASTGGLIWASLLQKEARAMPSAMRPPGALDEKDFNAKCIKCGQCVTACPYDTLKLANTSDQTPIGTPYFIARDIPCYMCPDIPCMKACPTGALTPKLENIEDARMGLAVIDIENCLSWLGLRCEICHRECPVKDSAITVEHHPRKLSKHAMFVPLVHSDACTGCGICEKACPTDEAAIKIVHPELVQGSVGEHYRLGWENEGAITQEFTPEKMRSDTSVDVEPGGLDYLNTGDL
ncbi:MAG: ferredoxin-type protein NapG [Gammaproteobacteria bacterium]|nr:ferredoxin-type protein NapG [Gammaproteobacteria bacterium]MBL6999690.1 ferredoxin-type protein NapG [Gammaproteobacteria bacterium]